MLLSYADTTEEPDDGRSEVIKAVIVNSAFPNINDKSGNWTDPNQFTWHPHRGYGRIDALQAFETLSCPKVFSGGTKDNLPKADIQLKSDGLYEVRITNTTDKANRAYALAFEMLEMLSGDLNNNFIVDEADLEKVMHSWLSKYDMMMLHRLSSQWLRRDPRYCVP